MPRRKKGQTGMEYLILVGLLLAALVPIFIYAADISSTSIRTAQSKEVVNKIATAANNLYKFGGGKTTIEVTMPNGIQEILIENQTIRMTVKVGDGVGQSFSRTIANISGNIVVKEGVLLISIETLPDGTVVIGDYEDLTPPMVTSTEPTGEITDTPVTLFVYTNEIATCKFDTNNITYDSMGTLMVGSGTSHDYELGSIADGEYLYYTRCMDTSSNKMQDSAIIEFTLTTEAPPEPDTDPPVVEFVGPEYFSSDATVTFTYQVTDASGVSECSLVIDGVIVDTYTVIDKGVDETFDWNLVDGEYSWYVVCTDSEGNAGTVGSRILYVDTSSSLFIDDFTEWEAGNCNIPNMPLDFGNVWSACVPNVPPGSIEVASGIELDPSGNVLHFDNYGETQYVDLCLLSGIDQTINIEFDWMVGPEFIGGIDEFKMYVKPRYEEEYLLNDFQLVHDFYVDEPEFQPGFPMTSSVDIGVEYWPFDIGCIRLEYTSSNNVDLFIDDVDITAYGMPGIPSELTCNHHGQWTDCNAGSGTGKTFASGEIGPGSDNITTVLEHHNSQDNTLAICYNLDGASEVNAHLYWRLPNGLATGESVTLRIQNETGEYVDHEFDNDVTGDLYAEDIIDVTGYASPVTCFAIFTDMSLTGGPFFIDEIILTGTPGNWPSIPNVLT